MYALQPFCRFVACFLTKKQKEEEMLKSVLLVLIIFFITIISYGCQSDMLSVEEVKAIVSEEVIKNLPDNQVQSETKPLIPVTTKDHTDLGDKSTGRSTIYAELGARVQVIVDIRQKRDEWVKCGNPKVKDVFGNVIMGLSPKVVTPGVFISYEYAFFATADGLYSVEFENSECVIRKTHAEADVTWTVYSP